jgi:formylglycine-generating enzyme required for sulfatase activity
MNRRVARHLGIVLCLAASIATASGAVKKRPTERVSPAPKLNANAVIWRTPKPPTKPQAGDVWVNPRDGMEMVYIAPGKFILGTSDAHIDRWPKERPEDRREWLKIEQPLKLEQPQCRVNLPGYWIGRTEVTNAQYLRFVQATGHRAPDHWKGAQIPPRLENSPVVFVDWQDAHAYCKWAGGRLPSELEWEKAARGTDGRIFPWGNQWDAKRCRNFELITGKTYPSPDAWGVAMRQWLRSHDPVREGPTAVGSYSAGASPYGCMDMAGNVWEWCADWFDGGAYEGYAKGDLTPPRSGTHRVLRGGSWYEVLPHYFRCANRYWNIPRPRNYLFGFRCARGRA